MGKKLILGSWRREAGAALLLLAVVLFFYRYLLSSQLMWTDDGYLHAARGAQYFVALREGQWPPRWAGNLAAGAGSPIFIFAYPLILISQAAIYWVLPGTSLVRAYNLSQLFFLLAGALGVYALGRQRRLEKVQAVFPALLYLLSPYLLVNVYNRSAAGEIVFLGWLPWVIWGERHWNERPRQWLPAALFAASAAVLMLAHQSLLPLGAAVIAIDLLVSNGLAWVRWRTRIVPLLLTGLAAFILAAWFWVPALVEMPLVALADLSSSRIKASFFVPAAQIFALWPGDRLNTNRLVTLGLAPLSVLLIALKSSLRARSRQIWWLAVSGAAIFLSTLWSYPFWQRLPIAGFIQFPWRLLGLAALVSALLGIELLRQKRIPRFWLGAIGLLLLVQAIGYGQPRGSLESKSDYELLQYNGTTTTFDEYTTRASTRGGGLPMPDQVILRPSGSSEILSWSNLAMEYTVTATEAAVVVQKTLSYPGWRLRVDGEVEPIRQDEDYPGRLSLALEPGTHQVNARFDGRLWYREASWYSSISGWLVLAIFLTGSAIRSVRLKP